MAVSGVDAGHSGVASASGRGTGAGDDDPRIGTLLDDRFRLLAHLGAGGMGVVYRAVQLSVGREVALKVMTRRPGDLANERFLREARLASRLSHPAIVTTYDCGRAASGEPWIAMERLHGRSLRQVLDDDGPLPVARALAIAEQLAAALSSAHAAGVIHRDVKPSNVMVLDDGRTKLLDFGLARADRGDDPLTQSGVVCGTPAYLAPEVALGRAADPRSDVYGLGLVLHEMLAGAHPFAAATPEAQVSRSLNELPPRLATVSAAVADVVQDLLARSPSRRCPSAAIARSWLASLRAGQAPVRPARHRRGLRRAWLALVPLAAAAVAFPATYLAARTPLAATATLEFRGRYVSAGNPGCSQGTAWLRIDGDRVTGTAVSDLGEAFGVIGAYRPSGAIIGAFTLGDHPLGGLEGEIRDGHARGTVDDHIYGCTGSFDLARAR